MHSPLSFYHGKGSYSYLNPTPNPEAFQPRDYLFFRDNKRDCCT
ncbi:hypothetical protein SAMN05216582_11070 [Selenomonas ruminantium]|uniref:Uncharacterized protein n=1 Tax=Selenomonas ruminantium TaxID=971 RepID=A0A1M6U3C9_SELRU|nr:hypothetical protein SAMN05216582_11070 [Selenomonas ruminantium]